MVLDKIVCIGFSSCEVMPSYALSPYHSFIEVQFTDKKSMTLVLVKYSPKARYHLVMAICLQSLSTTKAFQEWGQQISVNGWMN